MELPAAFERYRAAVDAELRALFVGRQLLLYDMMRYHLGWIDEQGNPYHGSTAKALRPTLCLLACEAVGGDYRRALPAAASLELVHNYSLIHDDIQDDDRERRHRPTVWSIWGKPQAINTGTAMRILGNMALLRLENNGISREKRARAQRLIDETTLRLLEGQYLDISYESRFDIGVADYLTMVLGKTTALITCSMELGALLGSDDESLIDGFRQVGRSLGLAFQMRDDILGIWGKQAELGKPLGSDIRRRKKTLPIVYALEKAEGEPREALVAAYQNEELDEGAVASVLRVLEAVDAQAQAQEMTEGYCREAERAVDRLALAPAAKGGLREVLHFLTERNF